MKKRILKFFKWLLNLPIDFLVAMQMKDYENQRKKAEIQAEYARDLYRLIKSKK